MQWKEQGLASKIYLNECTDYMFSKENLSNLLEGELIIDDKVYQYIGKNLNFNNMPVCIVLYKSSINSDNPVEISFEHTEFNFFDKKDFEG